MRLSVFGLSLLGCGTAVAADCKPVDFMALELPEGGDPVEVALEYAYPGADLDLSAGTFRTPDGVVIPCIPARDVSASTRLDCATPGDMFTKFYPLDYNLGPRQTAWFDPGRLGFVWGGKWNHFDGMHVD